MSVSSNREKISFLPNHYHRTMMNQEINKSPMILMETKATSSYIRRRHVESSDGEENYDYDDENDSHGNDDSITLPLNEQVDRRPCLNRRSGQENPNSLPLPFSYENQVTEDKKSVLRHLNIVAMRGMHYVEYAIGKPPQKVKLAVNLNSDYTVFRCSPNEDVSIFLLYKLK